MMKWQKVKLGDVLESQPKSKIKAGCGLITGKYPFYTCSNVLSKFLDEYSYTNEALIFGTGGNASIHYCNKLFATSTDCVVYYAKTNQISLKYIYHFILCNMYLLEEGFKGAGLKHISKSYIENINIPLPPKEEQERIAKELDAVSDLLAKQKQLLTEQDTLIKSVFYDMFGDPVTNDKGWKIEKFKNLGYLARGKSKHRPRNDPKLLGGAYPLIQTGDIAQADLYIEEYKQTYSDLGLAQSKMWNKGTLCITIAANIAKTAILKFDACFPDSVVGFISNSKSHIMFIQIWMSFLQKILEDNAPQAAQKNINLEILENLDVIVPPLPLQQKFADIVEQIEIQKQKIKSAITETETLFDALMAKYFDEE